MLGQYIATPPNAYIIPCVKMRWETAVAKEEAMIATVLMTFLRLWVSNSIMDARCNQGRNRTEHTKPTNKQLRRICGQRLKAANRKGQLRYMMPVEEVPMAAMPDGSNEKGSCVV